MGNRVVYSNQKKININPMIRLEFCVHVTKVESGHVL